MKGYKDKKVSSWAARCGIETLAPQNYEIEIGAKHCSGFTHSCWANFSAFNIMLKCFVFFSPWLFWFDNHFGNNPGCYSCWCDCFFSSPFSLPKSKPMLEEQRNIVKYIIEGYKGNKVSGWVATCGTKSLVPQSNEIELDAR